MLRPYLPPDIDKWMADAHKLAFLLDFDGTMIHLAPRPDEVVVPPELVENLLKISRNHSLTFAIVTGRALHVLDDLLKGMTTTAVGSHGAEWRSRSGADIQIIAPALSDTVRNRTRAIALADNCIFEDKVYTISMHLPFEHADLDLTAELLAATGDPDNFQVRRIGRTFELLQKNFNKGYGIRYLMKQPDFSGKLPIYIGDDVATDTTLDAIDEFHGIRLEVSNHGPEEKPIEDVMGIDSVNWIVQFLAELK
jgi:trehalose 6-phosphate phosphatase